MKRKGPATPISGDENASPNLPNAVLGNESKPMEVAAQAENYATSVSADAFIQKHLQPWTKNNKDPAVTVRQSLKEYLSIQDESGNTILHRAIIMGRFDIAERLIKSGIDVLIPNKKGQTPLELSKKTNATALISLLESKVSSNTMSQSDSSLESTDRAASREGKKTIRGRWAAFLNSPVIRVLRSLSLNNILPKSRRASTDSGNSEERPGPKDVKTTLQSLEDLLNQSDSEFNPMSPEEEATFVAHVPYSPTQSTARDKGQSVGVSTVSEAATDEDYDQLLRNREAPEALEAPENFVEAGLLKIKNDLGETAQHKAVEDGDLDSLKALLNKDANPNLRDNAGKTPLHVAVEKGNQEMVEVLLAAGAKPYIKDALGKTPLDLAIENGDQGLINALEEALKVSETAPTQQAPLPPQKEINTQPDSKQTPLHVAVKESNKEKVEKLLDEIKSDVNAKDSEGNTALHVAVARGDLEMVKTLMARGADIETKNNRKHSPLELAVLVGSDEEGMVSNASLYEEIINELTSQNEPRNEQIDDDLAILKDLAKNVDMQQFETEFEKSEPVELDTAGMRESEIEEEKAIQAELEAQRAASSDDPILKLYAAELKAPTQTVAEAKNEAKLDVVAAQDSQSRRTFDTSEREQLSMESMQSVSSKSQRNSDDLIDFISEDKAPILEPRQKGSDSISDEELENEIFSDEESDMGVVEAGQSISEPLSDEELENQIFDTELNDAGTVESSHTSDTAALSDLRNAVQEGDISKVKQLIAQGAHTQLENEEKIKVVDAAFEKMSNDPGNTDLSDLAFELQDLLSELPAESKDVEEGIEPIVAAQAEAVEVAAEKQERFSQVDSTQPEIQESVKEEVTGENVLHQAVRDNDEKTLSKFLVEGLVVPGRKGQENVIIKLDPNLQNSLGQTPLHLAAKEGQMALVDILLANGANPTIEDKEGNTPYRVAVNTLSDNTSDVMLDDLCVKLDDAADNWQKRAGAEKLQRGAGDEKVTENLNKEAKSQPVKEKVSGDEGKKENEAPLSRIQQTQQDRVGHLKKPLKAPPTLPTSVKAAARSLLQQKRINQGKEPTTAPPTSPRVEALKKNQTGKNHDQLNNQSTGDVKPSK